jgi:hypothetical protein
MAIKNKFFQLFLQIIFLDQCYQNVCYSPHTEEDKNPKIKSKNLRILNGHEHAKAIQKVKKRGSYVGIMKQFILLADGSMLRALFE